MVNVEFIDSFGLSVLFIGLDIVCKDGYCLVICNLNYFIVKLVFEIV